MHREWVQQNIFQQQTLKQQSLTQQLTKQPSKSSTVCFTPFA